MMGYLAAFQFFGYKFILRREMDEIREQFEYPDDRKTPYLDQVLYCFAPKCSVPLVTESCQPFLWGNGMKPDAPLHLMFRRCQVELPSGHWQFKEGVRHLVNLYGAGQKLTAAPLFLYLYGAKPGKPGDCRPSPAIIIPRWTGKPGLLSCRAGPAPVWAPTGTWDTFEVAMKTQGEIEAAICEGTARFEQEHMGRGAQGHSRPPDR